MNTSLLEKLRPPEIVLSDAIVKMLQDTGGKNCLSLKIRLDRGPCHDDWCEPIKKAVVEIVDKCFGSASTIVVDIRGIRVQIDGELYYSASKLRNRIFIDCTSKGQPKVEGFTAY